MILTIEDENNKVLASINLRGTQWSLSTSGWSNKDKVKTKSNLAGFPKHGRFGKNKINLTLDTNYLKIGDEIIFPPGSLSMDVEVENDDGKLC